MRLRLKSDKVKFYIDDVREYESIDSAMRGVDYVFHAAVLKQVPSCEFYPNKLFDYMAARKPIICAAEGEMEEKINETGCGIIAIPEDEKSIADAIIHLINLPQDGLKKMGDDGYKEIKENYSREKLAQKLIDLIKQ